MVHAIWKRHDDLDAALLSVKKIMMSELSTIHPDVKQKIIDYINAPGKYLRAGLCLYLAKEVEGHISKGKLYLAASIELLHLATLIHDDVIDEADLRRTLEPFHKTYTNKIAIYAGDYLLAYAGRLSNKGYRLLEPADTKSMDMMQYQLIERILVGELTQLMNQNNLSMTMKSYLKQIKGKTAFLFGMACQLGAWNPRISKKELQAARRMGIYLGMAFQLSDDLIDFRSPKNQSGKPRMQDIQNGIYTAPTIIAIQESSEARTLLGTKQNKQWEQWELNAFYDHLVSLNSFHKTETLLEKYIDKIQHNVYLLPVKNPEPFLAFVKNILIGKIS